MIPASVLHIEDCKNRFCLQTVFSSLDCTFKRVDSRSIIYEARYKV